jgi:SAM-dependent methyltransferase
VSDFGRYLRAKRSVDDRALDRRLLGDLREGLAERADGAEGPLSVLEVGAGIGTMLARFVEWDVLPAGDIGYTAVDVRPENAAELDGYLRSWADGREIAVSEGGAGRGAGEGGPVSLVLDGPERRIEVEAVVGDGVSYAEGRDGFDLVVGAALLDILDSAALDSLLGALAPGGLGYFPITFDGATRFRPAHPLDRRVEGRYHEHMDAKPGGSSRAGGDALERLRDSEVELLGVAGSDWVVRPVGGSYPAEEAFFLRFILDTVADAVGELGPPEGFEDWLARRRAQLDAAELVYTTHQLDFLCRAGGADGGHSEPNENCPP